ncbi:MAG: AP endonuclease, partial [Thermoplasmata archaeon]|nr:AP endonuclease [Thermoplasmata archaeon]
MLRFGPGGIPLSCKGRTLKDGVEDTHHLGLTALEAQVVRVNVVGREVREKEIGLFAREIQGEIVVTVSRKEGGDYEAMSLETPLEEGDMVSSLVTTIAKDYEGLLDVARLARDMDVQFSIHAP